jgi:S-adenosylmethionine hydrolase
VAHTLSPLVLLTDFGLQDAYVGVMKGVILRLCPGVPLIDLTHAIRPQDVRQAAFVLQTSYRYFPPESVFLVVVDPGVGSSRRPIAIETEGGRFVGPDNGVFSGVLAEAPFWNAVEIDPARVALNGLSFTFHGRDLFAPAAARLARGDALDSLGSPAGNPVMLPPPHLVIGTEAIQGEVITADHFGNIITSISPLHWREDDALELRPRDPPEALPLIIDPKRAYVEIGGRVLNRISRTYAQVPPGQITALVNSIHHLEIAVNGGDAQATLGVEWGEKVILHFA